MNTIIRPRGKESTEVWKSQIPLICEYYFQWLAIPVDLAVILVIPFYDSDWIDRDASMAGRCDCIKVGVDFIIQAAWFINTLIWDFS